jgi:hypothetical protein
MYYYAKLPFVWIIIEPTIETAEGELRSVDNSGSAVNPECSTLNKSVSNVEKNREVSTGNREVKRIANNYKQVKKRNK